MEEVSSKKVTDSIMKNQLKLLSVTFSLNCPDWPGSIIK